MVTFFEFLSDETLPRVNRWAGISAGSSTEGDGYRYDVRRA